MAKTRKRSIKTHKGTKKLKARVPTKVTGRNFTKMDVDEPLAVETYQPMNVEEALQNWPRSMDVERETIVTRDFLQKEPPKIPADYTPPTIHKGLVMHGSSMNERFTLPPNIEVVIFSRRGQVITKFITEGCLKWISKNFGELRTSDMEKYNRKTFVLKTTKDTNDTLKWEYPKLLKESSQYTTARRFDKFKSLYTSTIQIFRGGNACPNISLSNDKYGAPGSFGLLDFSPLKKDDIMTDAFIKAIPFPKTISLKDLVQDPGIRDKHIRLYLFCCRVESKGAEVPNSQASNASQKSRVGLTEEGDVFSFPKASDLKVRSKSGLASSFLGSRRK